MTLAAIYVDLEPSGKPLSLRATVLLVAFSEKFFDCAFHFSIGKKRTRELYHKGDLIMSEKLE
jgi:hypothetical protein